MTPDLPVPVRTQPPDSPLGWRSFSVLLMPVLVLCFAAQQLLIAPKSYDAYLFLSGYGMKAGHLWELLTCQLFHSNYSLTVGLLHLSVNLAGLWFVGRQVEAYLGTRRFVVLYCLAGLAGALAQGLVAVTGFLLPASLDATANFLIARFGESVGASTGLCGVLAFYCRWKWNDKLRLFWLIPVKGGLLLWLALFVSALLIVFPTDPNLAHIGHFVGLLTGVLFFKLGKALPREACPV